MEAFGPSPGVLALEDTMRRPGRIAIAVRLIACAAVLLATPVMARGEDDATSDWRQVRRAQGRAVTVVTRSAEPIEALLVLVDESRAVIATPARLASSAEWSSVVHRAESRWAGIEAGTGRVTGRGGREISREGLFEDGRKVGEWTSVARSDIVAISATWRKRGRLLGLAIGAAAGTAAGIGLGVLGAIANNETGNGDGMLAGAVLIPIVATAGGYYAFSHEETLRYRAATPPDRPIDEQTWQRIRVALPPSLRGGREF